ncbi:2Fe-2S iron-sulfur cluster-binding protein [Paraburkholderia sp. MM5384-R2]|uniref:2Fe-2S iron-sulfur cluster-binding protein n=1 Tax=Paraburkholderia sp. MM5384-R2 TaxID=2723097 RepID=UPI00160F1293|nr:2Fe-2S iron-sulfur cluster-binding protein [Paraburkholderia sp. MM5384-R2]MBB5498671.1 2Fe-2S ferredoxin [Paraburkholderia sp. MM5384-R2]
MPTITFIEHDGKEHRVDVDVGKSAMQAAVGASLSSILADCGGSCSCATCHGYVDPAWINRVPPADSMETDMIDCALNVQENSRLTCQIRVTEALDGLVIRLPASQI